MSVGVCCTRPVSGKAKLRCADELPLRQKKPILAKAEKQERGFSCRKDGPPTKALKSWLSVIRVVVTPGPVDALFAGAQLNKRALLVVLGLVPLVRAVFIVVPLVKVLVVPVVIAFVVVVAAPFFLAPVVLRAHSTHHCNWCS